MNKRLKKWIFKVTQACTTKRCEFQPQQLVNFISSLWECLQIAPLMRSYKNSSMIKASCLTIISITLSSRFILAKATFIQLECSINVFYEKNVQPHASKLSKDPCYFLWYAYTFCKTLDQIVLERHWIGVGMS